MSTMTEHYGLEMPLGSDYYDINVQNQNMEAVDAALWGLDEGKVGRENVGKPGGVASLGTNGQLPYAQTPHLTSPVTLYVDASTGNDSNPGTQEAPFATVQAAVNSLPKDLGGTAAYIYVALAGDTSLINISSFRNGQIIITGENSANPGQINADIIVQYCTCVVKLSFLQITGAKTNLTYRGAITATYSSVVSISNVTMDGGGDEDGVRIYGQSNIGLLNVEFNNCNNAINTQVDGGTGGLSTVSMHGCTGSGNTTALRCAVAIVSIMSGSLSNIGATTEVALFGGGLIVNPEGTIYTPT